MSDRFSLLFLCAGNRFRSPLAAAFVRRLTLGLPVEVASAGMLQIGDSPPLPEARTLGAVCGVDVPDPFGGSKKVYRTTAIQIQRLSLELVDELFGVTESAGLVLID